VHVKEHHILGTFHRLSFIVRLNFGAVVGKMDRIISIYANVWNDGKDDFLDASFEACRNFKNRTTKAIGVIRPPLNGKAYDNPMFWVYPHDAEVPADAKKTAVENCDSEKSEPAKETPAEKSAVKKK
jgi:hypothetical protein